MSARTTNTIDRLFSDHVGIDFSTSHVRVIKLKETKVGMIPVSHHAFPYPDGVFEDGRVTDQVRAIAFLKNVKRMSGIRRAYAALPESVVATEMILVPSHTPKSIRDGIEKYFASLDRRISDMAFDFRILGTAKAGLAIQIFYAEKRVLNDYLTICDKAGIALIGIEPRHTALARAISRKEEEYFILVDIHDTTTAVSILAKGLPIMTDTIPFGGADLTAVVAKVHGIDINDAKKMRDTHGVSKSGLGEHAFRELGESLVVLEELVKRVALYWHEQKTWYSEHTPLSKFLLSGEASTIPGLADYLSATLTHDVTNANVWENCFSFRDVIPDIHRDTAAAYAAAIGLALAPGPSAIALLSSVEGHGAVRREKGRRGMHKLGMIILTIIIAVALAAGCVRLYRYLQVQTASQNTAQVVQ